MYNKHRLLHINVQCTLICNNLCLFQININNT